MSRHTPTEDAELLEQFAKSMDAFGNGWPDAVVRSNDFHGLAKWIRAIASRLTPPEPNSEEWLTEDRIRSIHKALDHYSKDTYGISSLGVADEWADQLRAIRERLTPPEPSVEEVIELARAKWPDVDFEVIYRSWFDDGRHPWIFATNYMSPGINISAPTLAQLAAKLKEEA